MVGEKSTFIYINEEIRYYRLDFINELSSQFEGELVVFTTNKTDHDIKMEVAKIARLLEFKTIDFRRNEGFRNVRWNLQFSIFPFMKLKRFNPSFILIEGLAGVNLPLYLLNTFIGAKLICSYERTPQTEFTNGPFRNVVQRILSSNIDYFIVNGINSANVVRYKLKSGVPLSMPNVTPYPFTLSELKTTKAKKPTFIYVGQDNERKNSSYLRKLILGTPENQWIILGFKYDAANILFSGRVHWSEVSKYLQQSDYLILPTLEDNFSLVVLEALACGVEPITTVFNGVVGDALVGQINILSLDYDKDEALLQGLAVSSMEERRRRIESVSSYNAKRSVGNLLKQLSV